MLNISWITLQKYLHCASVKRNASLCDYSYHPEMTSNRATNFLNGKCVPERWDGNTNFIITINLNG